MRVRRETLGFMVFEVCDEWEQPLCLYDKVHPDDKYPEPPEMGVLLWCSRPGERAAIFVSRAEARAAINRTEHWLLAHGLDGRMPRKRDCVVRLVERVAIEEQPDA